MSRFDLEGVVFDVDGVLFDTERLSQETWNAVSTELNWPQVGRAYLEFVGQNRADILQKMLDLFGPDFPRETFLLTCSARSQARMEQEGVPLKPGVREILEFLTARGIPAALATSTNRERTHRRMEMTGSLGPCFSAVVTGDPGGAQQAGPGDLSAGLPSPGDRSVPHAGHRGLPQRDPLRPRRRDAGGHDPRPDPARPGAGASAVPALHLSSGGAGAAGPSPYNITQNGRPSRDARFRSLSCFPVTFPPAWDPPPGKRGTHNRASKSGSPGSPAPPAPAEREGRRSSHPGR